MVDEDRISMDIRLHMFTILGSERPHVVTLFPKETCSYPSSSLCYHILAATFSVGLDICQPSSRQKIDLTQLRRNARLMGKKSLAVNAQDQVTVTLLLRLNPKTSGSRSVQL